MLRKALGKTLDYFFGFGDRKDYYNTARNYNWSFEDESTQKIENHIIRTDKLFKIIIRVNITLFQTFNIYRAIIDNNPQYLLNVLMLETVRSISLFADYKNKKRILKNRDKALDNLFNPKSKKNRKRRFLEEDWSDINDADWWKNNY